MPDTKQNLWLTTKRKKFINLNIFNLNNLLLKSSKDTSIEGNKVIKWWNEMEGNKKFTTHDSLTF